VKATFLFLWGIWDWIYYHCNRLEYVSKEDNIFRIVRKTYKGPPLQTRNGDWIKDGDAIIKIHLYNYALAKKVLLYSSEVSLALYLKNYMKCSLRGLSQYIQQLPEDVHIKGIIGTSMLNRGAERFGFCSHDVNHSFFYWFKGYLYKLIYLSVHPYGLHYLQKHGSRLKSKHLVMSTNELYELYLSKEQ
jgi:hypothetical protein